ncbi:hypothetical protein Daus18300_008937 [Diaporthe australafricana]|uniref:Uncharacterized protein n=1 Tax=Diaporthe australafricana TaxID=127596 RepID=A0ABR3WGN9_9PEZI
MQSNDGSDDTKSTMSSDSASAVLEPTTSSYPTKNSRPANMPSPHRDPSTTLSFHSSDTTTNQVQSKGQEHTPTISTQTFSTNKQNKKPEMTGKTRGKTRGKTAALKERSHSIAGHEADQRLFDAAQAVIAQDRVIADSGLEVSRRMNECARDTMEANQIIERKEHEIAAIATKIERLTATFDDAHHHLLKAQEIAAEAIDSSVSEQFRYKEETNLINTLIGMTNEIAKKSSFDWPREKINKCLEDLESVYYKNQQHCQSPMVSSGIVHVAKHFVFHADYDDKFQPMLFHLANQHDYYKAFMERSRSEDQQFAKQHHVDYSLRPSAVVKLKINTGMSSMDGEASEGNAMSEDSVAAPQLGEYNVAKEIPWADSSKSKQEPSQNPPATGLPPRSSSLPSSLNIMPPYAPEQPVYKQRPGNATLPDSCNDPGCPCKHYTSRTDFGSKKWEDELVSKLEPRPGMTSNAMATAVLQSLAGVEAIFREGMVGYSEEVKNQVASAIKLMGRLNQEHVKSEEVAQKLSIVAKRYGSCTLRSPEASDGQGHAKETTAGGEEDSMCEAARHNGPESKVTTNNLTAQEGNVHLATKDDVDLMWRAFVSGGTPAKH